MSAPELPPEALADLCRYMGEYGWKSAVAARLLRLRYGIELTPLDAEYCFAVEMRRRSLE